MFTPRLLALLLLPLLIGSGTATASPNDRFIHGVFDGAPPEARLLWLTGEIADEASKILGHRPAALRQRYWQRDGRSAWIVDEIGKERPITIAVVIDHGRIEQVRVLAFRESRGGEVRHPFFTDQFPGTGLTPSGRLDHPIDGVTGATLSVRAVTRVARLALTLDRHVRSAP